MKHSNENNQVFLPPAEESSKSKYSCPMHPEIQQDLPGTCPKCGMALEPLIPSMDSENKELEDMQKRFRLAAIFTVPLFIISMGDLLPGRPISQIIPIDWRVYIELALATPVCIWSAWQFYARALNSLYQKSLNMFTLIGLGVSVAYIYSVVATLLPQIFPASFRGASGHVAVYFEAASVILTLILIGQVLELKARSKTGSAIKKLLGLAPKSARRIESDGTEVDVPLAKVLVGDKLRVRPGEKIPVDGLVKGGS